MLAIAKHLDVLTPGVCGRFYVFHTPGTLLTIQCKASPPAHQCWSGSSHTGWVSHLAHTIPEEDHHHVTGGALRPPAEWRPVGRLRTTWLRTINDDLQSLNIKIHKAWRKARVSELEYFKGAQKQKVTMRRSVT